MDELLDGLDDAARVSVEVAMGAAGALGDRQCGTEYLLYGLFATARGELSDIAELFALDSLRIERAVAKLREPFTCDGSAYDGDPSFSTRAVAAMRTLRHDGTGPTGPFELLYGILEDPRSGASAVLRDLGVRPEEVHRLAAYGRRHLSRDEAQALLEVLDRRRSRNHPWWGPEESERLIPFSPGCSSLEIGRSASAVASIDGIAVGSEGFLLSLAVESLRPWVLPPVVEPPEILVPGASATRRLGPEILRFEVVFADGERVSSLAPGERWRSERPGQPVMVPLSVRTETIRPNDRRNAERRRVVADWWIWPIPAPGTVELRVEWPAEVLSGLASFDGRDLVQAAHALPAGDRDA